MERIYAITVNTFREAVRDRVLYGVVGLAIAMLLFTLALGELSLEQQERVVVDIGTASISLFAVVVAVFLGSSLLYKEIERKTLYVILPKPIARWEFLLGKHFGIVLTAWVFVGLMGAVLLWVTAVMAEAELALLVGYPVAVAVLMPLVLWKAPDRTAALVPCSVLALVGATFVVASTDTPFEPLLAALALTAGEVLVLSAVALLFSSFSTPFLTGGFTVGVWLLGRSADTMAAIPGELMPANAKALLGGVARVVPNFNLFVPSRSTLVALSAEYGGPWSYVGSALGYATLYSAVALGFAAYFFSRRDLL